MSLPFDSVRRPSLALSLLGACLKRLGVGVDIRYLNLQFAELIGYGLYQLISEKLPQELLVGDLVFAPAAFQTSLAVESLRGVQTHVQSAPNRYGSLPEWVWQDLPRLAADATAYVKELAVNLCLQEYDLVGLTCMFNLTPSLALARHLKEHGEGEPAVILGGACCEAEMGEAIHEACPWIDFVCTGEGEQVLQELVLRMERECKDFSGIPGLVWRSDDDSQASCRRGPLTDLNSLPEASYGDWLEQVDRSELDVPRSELILPLETSRGCWHAESRQCLFCGLNGAQVAYRTKVSKRVMEEIRGLSQYGVQSVYAVDNILNPVLFSEVFPHMSPADHHLSLFFEVKSILSRRQMQLLKAAGVDWIQPGIESLNSEVLHIMHKGCLAYHNIRLLKWACEFGIGAAWNILFGFPGETSEQYVQIADLITLLHHLIPPTLGCNRVRLDRFSPLYNEAEAYGLEHVRPFRTYELAFPFPDEVLERIAYFFEYDYTNPDPKHSSAIQIVMDAIAEWQEEFGTVSLTYMDKDNVVRVFDHRKCASVEESTLCGVQRDVFRCCEAGATREEIDEAVGVRSSEINGALRFLTDLRYVIHVDNRYLGLPVATRPSLLEGAPEGLEGALCHTLYCYRMKPLKDRIARGLSLPAKDPGTMSLSE